MGVPRHLGLPLDPGVAGATEAEAALRRSAFRSILRGTGPDPEALGRDTGLDGEGTRRAIASLVGSGQVVVDRAGRVVGAAGLSLVATRHRLRLGRQDFHTWCAVDAVGIPAALRADASASTTCPACGTEIEVVFDAGRARPAPELRAWIPGCEACTSVVDELCPDMNLFCGEEHLEAWRRSAGDPPGVALPLTETEELGRRWWHALV